MSKHALLSVKDFQHETNLSRTMVYRLIEDKTIRSVRPRNKFFIPVSEIERLINSDEVAK